MSQYNAGPDPFLGQAPPTATLRSTFSPAYARGRTAATAEVHRDPEQPERPLSILVPSGLVAIASFAVAAVVTWRIWHAHTMAVQQGWAMLALAGILFTLMTFGFNYAWDGYDTRKAIKRTIIMVILAVAAIVLMGWVMSLLGVGGAAAGGSGGHSKSSGSKGSGSKGSSGSSSWRGGGGGGGGGFYYPYAWGTGSRGSRYGWGRPDQDPRKEEEEELKEPYTEPTGEDTA